MNTERIGVVLIVVLLVLMEWPHTSESRTKLGCILCSKSRRGCYDRCAAGRGKRYEETSSASGEINSDVLWEILTA